MSFIAAAVGAVCAVVILSDPVDEDPFDNEEQIEINTEVVR